MKLEKRQNPSSKVLMGLATVGAAGSASGALVQIDLIGNTITAGGGNQLNADLTGDGVSDFSFRQTFAYSEPLLNVFSANIRVVGGGYARAFSNNFSEYAFVNAAVDPSPGGSVSGSFVISFDGSSLGFAAGDDVFGLVRVTAGGQASTRGVTLNSLVFDDGNGMPVTTATDISGAQVIGSVENGAFTAVPEPSSLALLALGAAGVVTRRQRKKAAEFN